MLWLEEKEQALATANSFLAEVQADIEGITKAWNAGKAVGPLNEAAEKAWADKLAEYTAKAEHAQALVAFIAATQSTGKTDFTNRF